MPSPYTPPKGASLALDFSGAYSIPLGGSLGLDFEYPGPHTQTSHAVGFDSSAFGTQAVYNNTHLVFGTGFDSSVFGTQDIDFRVRQLGPSTIGDTSAMGVGPFVAFRVRNLGLAGWDDAALGTAFVDFRVRNLGLAGFDSSLFVYGRPTISAVFRQITLAGFDVAALGTPGIFYTPARIYPPGFDTTFYRPTDSPNTSFGTAYIDFKVRSLTLAGWDDAAYNPATYIDYKNRTRTFAGFDASAMGVGPFVAFRVRNLNVAGMDTSQFWLPYVSLSARPGSQLVSVPSLGDTSSFGAALVYNRVNYVRFAPFHGIDWSFIPVPTIHQ